MEKVASVVPTPTVTRGAIAGRHGGAIAGEHRGADILHLIADRGYNVIAGLECHVLILDFEWPFLGVSNFGFLIC
jgi:hypothetical protein